MRRLTAVLDSRADRVARYVRATALHAEGHSVRAVARLTGTCRTTIARWVRAGTYPRRASVLTGVAPYLDVIRERSLQQEFTGKQIIEEVVALGYTGSANGVYELLRWLRLGHVLPSIEDHQEQRTSSAIPTITPYSARQGAWLFIQAPETLKARDQERLAVLHETLEASKSMYSLVQEFARLLRHRPQDAAARLKTWLVLAKASTVVELARFAQGIGKDLSAVMGAVSSSWSNGQVEGQVTRVKLLKRQMYGRAKFDLLRARILLA